MGLVRDVTVPAVAAAPAAPAGLLLRLVRGWAVPGVAVAARRPAVGEAGWHMGACEASASLGHGGIGMGQSGGISRGESGSKTYGWVGSRVLARMLSWSQLSATTGMLHCIACVHRVAVFCPLLPFASF